jgi:hypothetical protein
MSRKKWSEEKLFFRLLNNKSSRTYWENIRELRSRGTELTFKECIKLSTSKNPKYREISIDILAQLGLPPRPFYKESKKLFFDLLLKEKNIDVLISIFYAISHNNDNLNLNNTKIIANFKNKNDANIKKAIVFALLGVNYKIAIETLIMFSDDKSPEVRNWATFGLGTQIEKNTKEIKNALWARVEDENIHARSEAIIGLANRKDKKVNEQIGKEIAKQSFNALIFDAITTLKAKEFLPTLKKILKETKGDESINKSWLKDLKECITELRKLE